MNELAYLSMQADLQMQKKLKQLLDLKLTLENELKKNIINPAKEDEYKLALSKVNDLIGTIRYYSEDKLNVLGNNKEEPVEPRQKALETRSEGFRLEDDDLYGRIDKMAEIEPSNNIRKSHLIGSATKLPRSTKQLADESEFYLYSGLRNSINRWYADIDESTDMDEALANLKLSLYKWANQEKSNTRESMQSLYDRGLKAGEKAANVQVVKPTKKIDYAVYHETGVAPAIDRLGEEAYNKLSNIIKKYPDNISSFKVKKECDKFLKANRYQTRRMIKSQVSSMANFGLLKAWSEDDNKFKYKYYWNSVGDNRTKTISKQREADNFYSYKELEFLWTHTLQKFGDKWENDAFNQRCSISREPIDYENRSYRFTGQEDNYQRTLPEV